VMASEAREQGKELEAHYAHLTVHGLLHLQGWEHENDRDARAMEAREARLLAALGYVDPYAVTPAR
jgi:probable rRNA maturation factor